MNLWDVTESHTIPSYIEHFGVVFLTFDCFLATVPGLWAVIACDRYANGFKTIHQGGLGQAAESESLPAAKTEDSARVFTAPFLKLIKIFNLSKVQNRLIH